VPSSASKETVPANSQVRASRFGVKMYVLSLHVAGAREPVLPSCDASLECSSSSAETLTWCACTTWSSSALSPGLQAVAVVAEGDEVVDVGSAFPPVDDGGDVVDLQVGGRAAGLAPVAVELAASGP
jgi:hypothetical protein